ncbi:MAG: acyl carrier protein [Xanthomonadales bacterium]|nr:acyl carrier protein [Xanthomonadales bacterium]
MDSLDQVRDYIRELLELKGERSDVSDDEPLLPAGLIDSLDVVQTVLFLEQNFGVDFSVDAFNPDDFESIESINRLVERQGSG